MALVASEGFACARWDPAYLPDAPRKSADVVNLGYVINVVEDPAERAATLKQAFLEYTYAEDAPADETVP